MVRKTLDAHIEITPGIAGGRARIAGHRIRVQDVAIWHEEMRMTAVEIAKEYDLTLADVHAALAYYYDHRQEIDKDIADADAFVEAMKQKYPSRLTEKLKGKLDAGADPNLHR
jgi:uncharacterized protein (DUF433 family)